MSDHSNENDALDDLVDQWHEDPTITVPLHEYLGMTWEQYAAWVVDPGSVIRPEAGSDG